MLKKFLQLHSHDILFLAEVMVDVCKVCNSFWNSLNLKLFAVNSTPQAAPNLWGLCSNNLSPSIVCTSDQHITCYFNWDQQLVLCSSVYASTSQFPWKLLWSDLVYLQKRHQGPWFLIGDFNCILGNHEKHSRCLP